MSCVSCAKCLSVNAVQSPVCCYTHHWLVYASGISGWDYTDYVDSVWSAEQQQLHCIIAACAVLSKSACFVRTGYAFFWNSIFSCNALLMLLRQSKHYNCWNLFWLVLYLIHVSELANFPAMNLIVSFVWCLCYNFVLQNFFYKTLNVWFFWSCNKT